MAEMLVVRKRGVLGSCGARRKTEDVLFGACRGWAFGLKIWAAGTGSCVCLPGSQYKWYGIHAQYSLTWLLISEQRRQRLRLHGLSITTPASLC